MSVIQQNTISTNSITEATSANGVSIDGLKVKDYSLMYGSNIGITIDSNGYVLKPNNPHFRGKQNGGFSTANTICQFSEETNVGNHWSTSNHRFTAPVAGVYLVTGNFISASSSTTTEQNIRIKKNGSTISDTRFNGYNQDSGIHSLALYLSAGDYIQFEIAGSTSIYSGGGHYNLVSITQLN